MKSPVQWNRFYTSSPNGRCRITETSVAAFEAAYPHRVLQMHLQGWPEKILLLDLPLKLGPRVVGSAVPELHLLRVKLRDVPGWPPQFPPRSGSPLAHVALDARLQGAKFKRRQSPALPRVEFALELRERGFKALLIGPPVLLLKCVEATLRQEGASGKKLKDLQEIRLISPER